MRYPEYRWIITGIVLALLATYCQWPSETEFIRVPLELPEYPGDKPEPVAYSPPESYGTPIKNWWGTPEDPVIWPD